LELANRVLRLRLAGGGFRCGDFCLSCWPPPRTGLPWTAT